VEPSFVTLNCSGSEVPAAFFDSDEVDRTEDFDDDVGVALGGRVACLLSTVPEVEVLLPCNGLDMAFLPDKNVPSSAFVYIQRLRTATLGLWGSHTCWE